jgi:hypothetical protein
MSQSISLRFGRKDRGGRKAWHRSPRVATTLRMHRREMNLALARRQSLAEHIVTDAEACVPDQPNRLSRAELADNLEGSGSPDAVRARQIGGAYRHLAARRLPHSIADAPPAHV